MCFGEGLSLKSDPAGNRKKKVGEGHLSFVILVSKNMETSESDIIDREI